MYCFQVIIHAQPDIVSAGSSERIDGQVYQTLHVTPDMLQVSFPVSFEQASADLAALPRMFVELDGSLVWVAGDGERDWQVDGVLYDRDGRLLYVELKGQCPKDEFERLLRALGWPETPLMFQLIHQAVYLAEADFRLWADREISDKALTARKVPRITRDITKP